MLKVNNKQIVKQTALLTYQADRKRNALSVFAIAMASFLIAMVCSIGGSYWNSLTQLQLRVQGVDYDIELESPREDQVDLIRSMPRVKYAGVYVSCAAISQYGERALAQPKLYWADETCWTRQVIPALASYTGHYPQKEEEIMLSVPLLQAMGIDHYETGMKLTITYDTFAQDPDHASASKTWTLCGWFQNYSTLNREQGYVSKAFYEKTGVKQTDAFRGALKIKLKNPLYTSGEIADMQKAVSVGARQSIAADDYNIPNFCRTALTLAVLLLMIFFSAYLFIYNTMYLSISRNIRYYGQLKTIGMTGVQLKGMIYRHCAWNCMFGIPAGLLFAWFVSNIVVADILHLINTGFDDDYMQAVPADPWIFLTAGMFALFTNFLSCQKPAKIVQNCSPIEAIRYLPGQSSRKPRAGKPAKSKHMPLLFSMALQNLCRDKKQTVVVILSFILSLTVFLTVNAAIYANNTKRVLDQTQTKDIQFVNIKLLDTNKEEFSAPLLARLQAVKGVQSIHRVSSALAEIPCQEEVYGDFYRALYASRYSPGSYEKDMAAYKNDPSSPLFATRLVGIDQAAFAVINQKLGNTLDPKAFADGAFAVAIEFILPGDFGIPGKTVRFRLPDGKDPKQEYAIPVAAVAPAGVHPQYLSGGYTPVLVVSESYAKKRFGETRTELINIRYETSYAQQTEQDVKRVLADKKNITCSYSKLETYQSRKSLELQIKVLGYTIGSLMALLALLNYANMTAAGIQNRAKELAALESIGMTKRQIQKMLLAEGMGYAICSIAASFLFGTALSYAMFDQLCRVGTASYAVPWVQDLALFAAAMLLCMLLPGFIYRRTQKESLIERLSKGDA
ncbi:MAG: ABC transporter permease [Eubacterium sp.]|nr:ABC transporter permease [Eubacterium sp.]